MNVGGRFYVDEQGVRYRVNEHGEKTREDVGSAPPVQAEVPAAESEDRPDFDIDDL